MHSKTFIRRMVLVLTGLCALGTGALAVLSMLAAAMTDVGVFHDEDVRDYHWFGVAALVFGVLFIVEVALWGFSGSSGSDRLTRRR